MLEAAADDRDAPVRWPFEIRQALDTLTHKQRHFAICVAAGMSHTDAYLRACDVGENTPQLSIYASASTLANHVKVRPVISLINSWVDRRWLLGANETIENCLGKLWEEAEEGDKSAARIAAINSIMKYHGAFVSRSEVRHIHELDTSGLTDLMSGIGDLLGLAVPITPPQKLIADVASVEFLEPDSAVPNPIDTGTL